MPVTLFAKSSLILGENKAVSRRESHIIQSRPNHHSVFLRNLPCIPVVCLVYGSYKTCLDHERPLGLHTPIHFKDILRQNSEFHGKIP